MSSDTFKENSQREDAKKTVKKLFEERYTTGKNRWFFTALRVRPCYLLVVKILTISLVLSGCCVMSSVCYKINDRRASTPLPPCSPLRPSLTHAAIHRHCNPMTHEIHFRVQAGAASDARVPA